jgi:DNA-binding ferritin-like protein
MGRIKTIEGFMNGTPLEKASSGQQVEAMVKEMKQDYKRSYRTLMTPGLPAARYEEAIKEYWGYGEVGQRYQFAQQLISSGGQYISPGQGVRSSTGALTYQDNKQSYRDVGNSMKAARFKVGEHSDFGPVGQHAANSYHKYDEAFDVTHQTGDYATSIAKTRRLKEVIRSLNLFKEVIGPGDGDPDHTTHLHLGGLMREITEQDIAMINSVN